MPHPTGPAPTQPFPDLAVSLGRLRLPNPIMVASGTFGYAREMNGFLDLARLGGIVPKTITPPAADRERALADHRDSLGTAQLDRTRQ